MTLAILVWPEHQELLMDYKEITVPGGTFRMYDDRPNVWIQILQPGEKSVVEKIEDAFAAGQISKKNKD